jgi:AmmeMemoRadiSam system protein B
VIFLQYLFDRRIRSDEKGTKSFKIVPILCASFHEMLTHNVLPIDHPRAGAFIKALKETIAVSEASGKRICLIAGADLTHMGQRFGDQESLTPGLLSYIEVEDRSMLDYVTSLNAEGFFRALQKDQDRRRICGFPSIYTLLSTVNGTTGNLLQYDQAVDPAAQSVVSFASVAVR